MTLREFSKLKLLGAALPALMLSACAVGPKYQRPEMNIPAHYKEQSPDWTLAKPADEQPKGDWWTVFHDPTLNSLVSKVAVSNQNLLASEAQYRQSVALAKQAQSAWVPQLNAGVTSTRSFTGAGAGTGSFQNGTINSNHRFNLTASWEPDLWGNISSSVKAAQATVQASKADLNSATLSVQSQLVKSYFALRIADSRELLLQQTVDSYKPALQIATNQYEAGIVTKADVASATAQLKAAEAQIVDAKIQRAQLEHAIAVLLGMPPSEFSIKPLDKPYNFVLPRFALELPATLLERRPDIAAAERRVAAANARIGVAQAARFPSLTISASAGFQSSSFARWFTYPARFWSLGPSLAQTVFDGGLKAAKTEQALAAYDQTVAQYRQTVLGALQEVEDNLVATDLLKQQAALQKQAVDASQESLTLNANQYEAGTVGYLNVLNAQTTLLNNQRALLTTQGNQLAAATALIAALGGAIETAPNEQTKQTTKASPTTSDLPR